jgi:L-lactate dehydrogenase (cytochrome)/(S)-mandelate dehydrogenase
MANVSRAVTVDDLRALALRRLPEFVWQPMETGSGNGNGPRRNVERFKDYLFRPQSLVDVAEPTHAVTIFGRTYAQPFGISAIGYADYFRRHADTLFAQAAAAADIPFILSGGSIAPVEKIARTAPSHSWFQLYSARDTSVTQSIIDRARDAGIQVLVLTVDVPVMPQNDWLMRSGLRLPASVPIRSLPYVLWQLLTHPGWTCELITAGGFPTMESWTAYAPKGSNSAGIHQYYRSQVPAPQTWPQLEQIRRSWPGKLVIKGLLTAEDAVRAVELGADAITVSNHGGNRLDCIPAALDALPAVHSAVGGRLPVFFDGGIRRGSDILAAYCLGASFCFIGRAALYGAAAGGVAGVSRAIEILQRELKQTMAMLGLPSIARAGPDWITQTGRVPPRQT